MATTYYIPSVNGWADGHGYYFRLAVTREYNQSTNVSSLSIKAQVNGAVGGNSTAPLQITTDTAPKITYTINGGTSQTLRDYAVSPYARAIGGQNTWLDVCTNADLSTPQVYTISAPHTNDGALTVVFTISGIRIWKNQVYYSQVMSGTGTLSVSEPRASSIASISSSVATQGTLAISMNRASTAFYHKATFMATGVNVTSSAFAASLSYTVPRTWFNSYPSAASFTLNVSIQTYTNSACTTAVGSPVTATVTITADAGIKPSLASGFLSAAATNNPSGISGYVQGRSKAAITLNAAKVTYANNAALASYKVVCQSYTGTGTGTSYTSNVLTGSGTVTITATVTDSRGRTASQSVNITVQAYATPTITAVSVYRSDSGGTADDDGAYIYLKATLNVSSVTGNSGTMKYKYRAAGGSWSAETAISSNTAVTIGGSLDPDVSYEVTFTASDKISSATPVTRTVSTRKWAMKFRPTGEGVAFGMAPQADNVFEVTPSWLLKTGAITASGQIKTSFKESVAPGCRHETATTIPDIINSLCYSSGCMGSFSLGTAYTKNNMTIPTGWYTYVYIPHRTGGLNGTDPGGDNVKYGNLFLIAMTATAGLAFVVHLRNGNITEVAKFDTNVDVNTGTVTYAYSGGTFQQYACHETGGVVNVSARAYGISRAATGHFFTVPAGFRPRALSYGMGYHVVGGSTILSMARVATDGKVYVDYSGSATTTQVGFALTYHI